MSILGVKKKQVDIDIEKINIDLQTINSNDNELYKGINNVTLRVSNNEKMIDINKNKPDRKIICIYAGIDGPITAGQLFNFGVSGKSFFLSNPVKILSVSIISSTSNLDNFYINVVLYTEGDSEKPEHRRLWAKKTHTYWEFASPILVKAGYTIGFSAASSNPKNINTLVSALIEIDI